MTAERFLDTNILLYAGSQAPEDGSRCQRSVKRDHLRSK
jgi:predicted nucleic acid-binding protein